jgi:pimeloyl-ACP methyl ester carboxylesterase
VLPAAQGKERHHGRDHRARAAPDRSSQLELQTPVVFIHGLWLLPSSWDNWVGLFEENGYAGVRPPGRTTRETVEEARANPEVVAKKTLKQVADHTATVIDQLDKKPAGGRHGARSCY